MPVMPPTFRAHPRSKQDRDREADQRRGSARQRGYTSSWDKAAKAYLDRNPLCEYSALDGKVVQADLVDHLYPHRHYGGFWDKSGWVACSRAFHDSDKQSIERQGKPALDALARRLGRPTREG